MGKTPGSLGTHGARWGLRAQVESGTEAADPCLVLTQSASGQNSVKGGGTSFGTTRVIFGLAGTWTFTTKLKADT